MARGTTVKSGVLVIRVNRYIKDHEMEELRSAIAKQRSSGVVVLPCWCEPMLVPADVEVKVEGLEPERTWRWEGFERGAKADFKKGGRD